MKKSRSISAHPFSDWCSPDEVFRVQFSSLATRLDRIGVKSVTIGLSGGLDSTLCLLVAVAAFNELKLPKSGIRVYTMPGFGTTNRTKGNAELLCEGLGLKLESIDITSACIQHFKDIGHDPEKHDVTYENVQARMRTMVLMNKANQTGGIVLGTGDMSEAALGWCTFNGDHMASYNVNVCLNKSVIRRMVTHLSHGYENKVGDVLRDIVDTPVSPELLPPDNSGKIAQKTEDILGSYDLHDFFLYYVLKYNMRPQKIYYYACVAFEGVFEAAYIKEKLSLFFRRFITNQFKRSCAPDFAKITDLCLADYQFPSECSPATLVHQLEKIEEVTIAE
jgi:NAD+ synthase (glutamine-hydrolysing)